MKKYVTILCVLLSAAAFKADAQYYYPRVYVMPAYPARPYAPARRPRPSDFKPSLNIMAGYGFPNLDRYGLASFYNSSMGSINQTGLILGSIDYQFSPYMSVGIMGTYGKVTAPYYNYSGNGNSPSFTGSLENYSIMFDLISYFPTYNKAVSPYLRTAIGVNNWNQSYADANGNSVAQPDEPGLLAYQVSLGLKINMTPNTGIFLEGGYGKYILAGGLAFKF